MHTPETDRLVRVPRPVMAPCNGVMMLPTNPPLLVATPDTERPPTTAVLPPEAKMYWVLVWRD